MALLNPTLRKASVIAAALLAGAASTVSAAGAAAAPAPGTRAHRTQTKMNFFRDMQEATKHERKENLRKLAQRRMDKRILNKAVPMPGGDNEDEDVPDFLRTDTTAPLAGLYQKGPSSSSTSPAAAAAASSEKESKRTPTWPSSTNGRRRKLDDGDDDEVNWENFGFDPSEYSIKYTGCSAIAMYSDENAEDGDATSVLETSKFVVFRLCPSAYCADGSENGCGQNYGEYLIPLADYLDSYMRFKEELSEAYCEYCEQCMYFENYFYGHRQLDDAGDDAAAADGDDAVAAGDDAAAAEEGDDAVQDDDSTEHACKYYTECVDYLYTCDYDEWYAANYDDDNNANGDDNADEAIDYQDYFECQEIEYGNYVYYVGPMCSSDDGSVSDIKFGIFDDEYCSNYVGNKVDISDVTGIDFASEEASLDFYSSGDCISCRESDVPYMIVNNDADDEDEISELCEELYLASAKCNKKLWEVEDGSYQSYNQMANENLVCAFIENVINGAYDDNGYIVIDEDEYDQSKLFSANEISKASIGQIFGVLVMVMGCAALVVWSCFLHRALQQRSKLTILPPEQEFARQESGVMVGRSMSREFPENPENDHVLT